MKFIADLHIHSHYSRATSKELTPEHLRYWAKMKGITLVGTGDFTHPGWTRELKEKLEPAEDGLFQLKPQFIQKSHHTPYLPDAPVRFLLTAEISNIYKKNGKVRKVHSVIFAPDFKTVDKIQQKLTGIQANITSDGRPILGLDSKHLLEMMLECNENIFFIPAHIWTPWFSILGSKSGFDSVEECFDDLSHHIHAVETGLSTDPPMNWMCSFLDNYTLVSNSDAHSPERLGRNATLFNTQLSYDNVIHALKTGDPEVFQGTIDLFPQAGKYHYDGHRKCNICWDPVHTLKHNCTCPACGKPVTVGVMNRVVQLSDREDLHERSNRAPFHSIIPLKEILGEIHRVGPNSKKVHNNYMELIQDGTPELQFLLHTSLNDISRIGGSRLAEAIRRMRNREVFVQEGYDGEYGVITVFHKNESPVEESQALLFKDIAAPRDYSPQRRKLINFDLHEYRQLLSLQTPAPQKEEKQTSPQPQHNPDQWAAVRHFTGPALVIAGPGTGKTRVLTHRILHLVREKNIPPQKILAVTFTNKAAAEIAERVRELLPRSNQPHVATFHSLGYNILKELCQKQYPLNRTAPFNILDPDDKKQILKDIPGVSKNNIDSLSNDITNAKQQLQPPGQITQQPLADIFKQYQDRLEHLNAFDLDDLIYLPVLILDQDSQVLQFYRETFQWIMVDEYQDVNHAQYRFIRTLMPTGEQANLCVIGDPDQAIYSFRGADVRFIQQFRDHYPDAVTFHLKTSYRCPQSILRASGHVVRQGQQPQNPLQGITPGVKIKIVQNDTHKSEAEYVARTIEEMMGGLRFFSMDSSISQGHEEKEIKSLSDFVVLCRVKSQVEAVEKAFHDHAIPYQLVGDTPFFRQEPVKTILDILKLSLQENVQENKQNNIIYNNIYIDRLRQKNISPLQLDALQKQLRRVTSPVDALQIIINEILDESRQLEHQLLLRQLLEWAEPCNAPGQGVPAFLKFAALGTPVDTYRPHLENVTLMTLHAAKGLEFKCVFIIGCEEGLLPYNLFPRHTHDIQEERRLLYVGMTRAKKFLFLTHAAKRTVNGRQLQLPRSTFLDNIEKELFELSQQKSTKKDSPQPIQRSLFPA